MDQQSTAGPATRKALHDWLQIPPGRHLAEVERARIEDVLPDLFGYHLLQVGHLGHLDLLRQSRVLHRAIVDVDGSRMCSPYPQVRGTARALPVESDSVDVLIFPHVLEFDDQPHEALREALRVLMPEGHLLICGFNPISVFGLSRIGHRRGRAPWCGEFFSVKRIKDWLALLGFDVLQVRPCFVGSPLRNDRWLERLDAFARLGNRTAPVFSGAYLMVAQKRVTTLTPIKPRWRPKRRLVSVGLAEPTARVVDGG